jgi:hypothetical protein
VETFSREFNEARRQQGFRSQAHLDAFLAYHDHASTCGECGQALGSLWLEGDALRQPAALKQCPAGRELDRASLVWT